MKLLISTLLLFFLAACAEEGAHGGEAPTSTPGTGKRDGESAAIPQGCDAPATGRFDPNAVHQLKSGFEGWYYRFEDQASGEGVVLIVAYWGEGERVEGFIELIESDSGAVYKATYAELERARLEQSAGKELDVTIGGLRLRADGVSGAFITDEGAEISIDLAISGCRYWGEASRPDQRRTMGWVTELPLVPLKWHTHHLRAVSDGVVEIDGRSKWFEGALTHQEKNWGSAFPERWVWFQANEFEGGREAAFVAAGGPIFAFRGSPEGYMAGLQLEDRFIGWRTHDLHRFGPVRFKVEEERVSWSLTVEGWRYRLELSAEAPRDELVPVDVPTPTGLQRGAVEHLRGQLTIKLYERAGVGWAQIDELVSTRAALEAGGRLAAPLLQD